MNLASKRRGYYGDLTGKSREEEAGRRTGYAYAAGAVYFVSRRPTARLKERTTFWAAR